MEAKISEAGERENEDGQNPRFSLDAFAVHLDHMRIIPQMDTA